MIWQTTLAAPITFEGLGVHTGEHCIVTAKPAAAETGVIFQRVDLPERPLINPQMSGTDGSGRCTRLGNDEVNVATVEHLLAALRGLEVDNCLVEVNGPEIPIADGSAASFVEAIEAVGITQLSQPRRIRKLLTPVWVSQDDRHLVALPCNEFRISFTFVNDRKHAALNDQFAEFTINPTNFAAEIAPARTIGWLAEVKELRQRGLIKGGSADIAVIIGDDDVLTPLRYFNEPVRHKILDLVGDLAALGHVYMHVIAVRSGHQINAQLAASIAAALKASELS